MLRPHAGARRIRNDDLRQRLGEVRRQHPESRAWLALFEAALDEYERNDAWEGAAVSPAPDRPAGAPLLYGSAITVDGRTIRRWVRRLLALAAAEAGSDEASLDRVRPARLDATALLEAAVCQDDPRVDALAAAAGADPYALRVVAQMGALPLLQERGRAAGLEGQRSWLKGYCPVCGAWPTLAEFRGLERKRWLRCGRCGAGWEVPWLRCVFCDEANHENLGYLTPEEGEQSRRAEVCYTCKGYLKAQSTVRALPEWGTLLEDLATVPLDVAALERGYQRPQRPGYQLEVRLVLRPERWWSVPLGGRGREADS